jgi:hypothetical protein
MMHACTAPVGCVAPLVGLVALSGASQQASAPEDRSQGFRPVEGGGNAQSGELLLVEAYAVFWIAAMALLLATWRKQNKLDARIDGLRADLARAREIDDDAPNKAAKPR